MHLQIESGIPIPDTRVSSHSMPFKTALQKMNVGDSVVVENRSRVTSLHLAAKAQGRKTSSRKIGEKYRVWRIE